MKHLSRKIFLGSLTSLTALTSGFALAQEIATAPSFEGGVTASIGTFYAVPSTYNTGYMTVTNNDNNTTRTVAYNAETDYDFGWQGSLGYIFEDTANGIELFYRGFDGHKKTGPNDGSTVNGNFDDIRDSVRYNLNAVDLMISQYLDVGTHVQMRFSGGISYANIEQKQTVTGADKNVTFEGTQESIFNGLGPRFGMDARYDFGEEMAGFGIVGGASLAFYLGENKTTVSGVETFNDDGSIRNSNSFSDEMHNSAVTNLRGNLGIDYVYFFEDEESTLGIELGYLVDYYDDAVAGVTDVSGNFGSGSAPDTNVRNTSVNVENLEAITFSGPYLNIKGVF